MDVSCSVTVTNHLDSLSEELDSISTILPHTLHQKPEWLTAYIDSFERKAQTRVLQVRELSSWKTVGLLPLEIYPIRGTRFWSLRRLVSLAHEPSDFANLLFYPGYETIISESVARWLWLHRQSWDELILNLIPASSPGWKPLQQALEQLGFPVSVDTQRRFYRIDTTQEWERYFDTHFQKKNRDLLKDIRRLQRDGFDTSVVRIRHNIKKYFSKIFPIYEQRRDTLGQNNKYAREARMTFLTRVLEAYEANKWVELSMLIDTHENVWAFQLDWLMDGVRYHYMHAYNEHFRKYSPGKLLLYRLVEQSFKDPFIKECNYMLGEAKYKSRLANDCGHYVTVRVSNPWSARNRITSVASILTSIRDRLLRNRRNS